MAGRGAKNAKYRNFHFLDRIDRMFRSLNMKLLAEMPKIKNILAHFSGLSGFG